MGTRSEKKIEMSAGPGAYEVDRAGSPTKTRVSSAVFSKEKARPHTFAKAGDMDIAPG